MLPTPVANPTIPTDTYRIATAILPEGNRIMRIRDTLGPLFQSTDFAHLFPALGQPALDPAGLALVTVLQCLEGLSDRHAAENVRRCIDWKYALALPLEDPGFDASVLSEFRTRLIAGHAEHVLFETLLTRLPERGLLTARGRQRTDSTHVLAAIRVLKRLTCVGETLRQALNDVATVAPDWLQRQITPDWFDRYSHRREDYRLPSTTEDRHQLAAPIGRDGFQLLTAVQGPPPRWGSGSGLPSRCCAGSGCSRMTRPRPRYTGALRKIYPRMRCSSAPLCYGRPRRDEAGDTLDGV